MTYLHEICNKASSVSFWVFCFFILGAISFFARDDDEDEHESEMCILIAVIFILIWIFMPTFGE